MRSPVTRTRFGATSTNFTCHRSSVPLFACIVAVAVGAESIIAQPDNERTAAMPADAFFMAAFPRVINYDGTTRVWNRRHDGTTGPQPLRARSLPHRRRHRRRVVDRHDDAHRT